jgi:hypothetical protein
MTATQGPLGSPEGQAPLGSLSEPDYLRAIEGKAPGCTCPGAAEVLMAEINGDPRPLCAQHDAAEIRARAERDKREALEVEAGRLGFLREQVLAEDRERAAATAQARADDERAEALAAMRETDPLLADLTEKTGAPIVPTDQTDQTAIGDDDGIEALLNAALNNT